MKSAKASILALTFALLFAAATAGIVNSQAANGKYDTDGDGLIEVNNLEQLSAIRYDLDGNGTADSADSAEAYARAFTTSGTEVVCAGNCAGYELFRSLDFDDADSYASGIVNTVLITGTGWLPIGTRTHGFNTTFDGNEHTISNLYIDRTGMLNNPGAVGLFGAVGESGVVREIGLVDVDVTGVGYAGGLVGDNSGTISASYATGAVAGRYQVGGLAGRNVGGTISGSHATGAVTGTGSSDYVGGLVGDNQSGGTISDSYATGAVTGSDRVGGLAGSNGRLAGNNYGTISGSHATGAVAGGYQVGGLVGSNVGGTISGSHATGAVTGRRNNVGGLVGSMRAGTISDSYATGSVTGSHLYVGGLAGSNGRLAGNNYGTISG